MSILDEKYTFQTLHYDKYADLDRDYLLSFYTKDNSVEMIDVKNKRLFLKRSKVPGISLSELRVGNTVVVHSRQLRITDYFDDFTRSKLGSENEEAFGMVHVGVAGRFGPIIEGVEEAGLALDALFLTILASDQVEAILRDFAADPELGRAIGLFASAPVVVFRCSGRNALRELRHVAGRGAAAPLTLSQVQRLGVYVSPSGAAVARDAAAALLDPVLAAAQQPDSALVIVKPHILREGRAGAVVRDLEEAGFPITAACLATPSRDDLEEFLQVYHTVLPGFTEIVSEMSSGPCMILEVTREDAAPALRAWAGQTEPLVAQSLAPRSVRARLGRSVAQNAVHVTDLDEDVADELEFALSALTQ